MSEELLTPREQRRYISQISKNGIGKEGQEKLKKASIFVAGSGGVGTAALSNLIKVGFGRIGISDDSVIQEGTLCKQIIFGDNDIGKQKAIVTGQILQNNNLFSKVRVHNIKLNSTNIKDIINDYNLIVDSTNNEDAQMLIAKAAVELDKPVIFCSVKNSVAIVTCVFPGKLSNVQRIIPDSYFNNSLDTMISSPDIIIHSITGAIIANESIQIILGYNSQLIDNLLIINANTYSLSLKKRINH